MQPRLIIVEGVDATGKSTLTKALANKLNAVYFHASGHVAMHSAMQAHHENILDNAQVNLDNGHSVILDRHWPSEMAYASVLRPAYLPAYNFNWVQGRLACNNPVYIHCVRAHHIAWPEYVKSHATHDRRVYRPLTESEYIRIGTMYLDIFFQINNVVEYCVEEQGKDLNAFIERFI